MCQTNDFKEYAIVKKEKYTNNEIVKHINNVNDHMKSNMTKDIMIEIQKKKNKELIQLINTIQNITKDTIYNITKQHGKKENMQERSFLRKR